MSTLQPIPQVPTHLFGVLGNLPDIDASNSASSIWRLTDLHGPIYQLDFVNRKTIVVSSYEFIQEILNDDNYEKTISNQQNELRLLLGDGLFTAFPGEKSWAIAHRVLMPVFGPLAVRKMFDSMLDIVSQMILKWDRLGPSNEILCSDEFTRLTFDTIGLCGYSFRFNDFYTDKMHPFATQMSDSLIEAGKRGGRTKLETSLRYFSEKKLYQDVAAMHELCDEILADRIANPQPDNHDLLNAMLNISDPETGAKLSKENMRYQIVTFLVAGHETTSGTLTFLFYHLLRNPETYHKAQKEVDDVLGDSPLTVQDLPRLTYIAGCVKETLRMQGPVSFITRHSKKSVVLAGQYAVEPENDIILNLGGLHHDPAVWGDDHATFKPERMVDTSNVPDYAFKAFGTGMRACIGRAFAEQEMIMCVALILQRFQVEMVDPSYTLHLKATLSVKPADFFMRVRRRPGKSSIVGLQAAVRAPKHEAEHNVPSKESSNTEKGLTILYGSNAGTCRAYAEDLAANAEAGRIVADVMTLDAGTESLPKDHPVVFITPSYEGKPADNAKKFCSWLEANSDSHDKLKGVRYAVFGVGNREWASTFHKVPRRIDQLMSQMGAVRIVDTGFVDVSRDTVGPWQDWCENICSRLGGHSTAPGQSIKATISKSRNASVLAGFETSILTVIENVQLADSTCGPAKMHMEVKLPEGTTYRSGEYLAISPWNPPDNVIRVLNRFKIKADDTIQITETRKEFLKTANPVSLFELLSSTVELGTPISQRQLEKLCGLTNNSEERSKLMEISQQACFESQVLPKRFSVLDILEEYPSCELDFVDYLDLLQPLSPRQYSISSSPLSSASFGRPSATASITYDVIDRPAICGGDRQFHGVASTFLASRKAGSQLNGSVRVTNAAFHLPVDHQTPVIMVAAGTGLAPMRGFLQERAAIAAARHVTLGPALLYFGCRDFEHDYIYRKELEHWESEGIVSLRPCFSKKGPTADSFHYTSDRLYAEKDELARLFLDGAKIFVCGSASKIAKSTAETCKKIWMDGKPGRTEEEANEWLDQVKEDRYVSDVFG